ncbi:winged helix-turn-helix domain-containing protein [Maritimibacter sp. UBA3975]|uniref:winged helix-turn-helix domain-containing protein n=1 Tax=Maritimibacter sp. UBA3975 TaxID=1946833 RepID=UPI0025B7C68B|nr:winged helix-turn-helix domain-containing protein [Maritimibacter sp. UBA3975]
MPLECTCPVCGSEVEPLPITLLPERGMVIHGGSFVSVTGSEMAILRALSTQFPRVVSKESLLTALTNGKLDEPEIKIVDVMVCKVRKKVAPLGIEITTSWGQGYSLTAPARIVREELV